jgi:TPR repeat protein
MMTGLTSRHRTAFASLPKKWFVDACASWDEGRLEDAFRLFLAAARAGDSGAQINVGHFYDTGKGVSKSRDQAMYWFRRAWRRGEAAAANNIGTLYRDEGRLRLAIRWFEKAVSHGDDGALLNMARLYLGPLNDIPRARRLLSRVLSSERVSVDSQEQAERLLHELDQRRSRPNRAGDHRSLHRAPTTPRPGGANSPRRSR